MRQSLLRTVHHPNSMPVAPKALRVNYEIYAIVRNVVTPARISPSTVLPASVIPNCLSSASIFSPVFLTVAHRLLSR